MNRSTRHEAEKRGAARQQSLHEGLSIDEAERALQAQARRRDAIRWLRHQIFAEEDDSLADSVADARDRQAGRNPMDADYQARIAAKRASLGIPALDAAGLPTGNQAEVLCERLVEGLLARLQGP